MPCDFYFHFRTLTRRITEIQNQSSKRFIRYNSLPNYRLNYIPVSMTHLLWVIGRHNDEMLLQVNLLVFACLVNQLSNQILLQLKISKSESGLKWTVRTVESRQPSKVDGHLKDHQKLLNWKPFIVIDRAISALGIVHFDLILTLEVKLYILYHI